MRIPVLFYPCKPISTVNFCFIFFCIKSKLEDEEKKTFHNIFFPYPFSWLILVNTKQKTYQNNCCKWVFLFIYFFTLSKYNKKKIARVYNRQTERKYLENRNFVFPLIRFCMLWCALFQVSDTDLEVIAATTGKSPSEDSGLGLTVPDIRNRYIFKNFFE